MGAFLIDRRFDRAASSMFVAALCTSCGLIHCDQVFLPWNGQPGVSSEHDMHWRIAGAYALCGVLLLGCCRLESNPRSEAESPYLAVELIKSGPKTASP